MNAAAQPVQHIAITPETWVYGALLFPLFGFSEEAAKKYRDRGLWLEGVHWRKNAANRIVYNRIEINKWMASQ